MTEIIIRPAQKKEAADLAILDNMAGFGISLWFWQGAVKNGKAKDALNFGRSRFASYEIFAWRNAYVAIADDMVAGSITSYVMPPSEVDGVAEIKKNAPPFVPVFELYEQAAGSWFVDSFAVFEEHQGKGWGDALLKNSLLRGKHTGAEKAMLVAEDTNTGALALYEKHGFQPIDERPYIDFGLGHKVNKWLLLATDY
ncbi:MAG: N-acetyltransferase [Rhizobiaceae bacterium]|nr:N-acetyltransferase [Rhizobiaceae bacterium]